MKKVWLHGEKSALIAEIARAHVQGNLQASLSEIFTVVQKEIARRKLDIHLYPSLLKSILMAEKRDFCFARVPGKSAMFCINVELLGDIVRELTKIQQKRLDNLRHIGSAPLARKKAVASA